MQLQEIIEMYDLCLLKAIATDFFFLILKCKPWFDFVCDRLMQLKNIVYFAV